MRLLHKPKKPQRFDMELWALSQAAAGAIQRAGGHCALLRKAWSKLPWCTVSFEATPTEPRGRYKLRTGSELQLYKAPQGLSLFLIVN
jgi:hypothetical protein